MEKEVQHKHTNSLIHESSPYLLQHAHNPVNWYPWGEEALKKAREENKLIIISIGYSACHWCHVMERESFEDEEVASYMNENFVCIKVDREERPDIDQIYMNAVQLITGQGGWPLNCFALPDSKPFYGGTYFSKKNWLYLMKNVVTEYEKDPNKVRSHAEEVLNGIRQSERIPMNENAVDFSTTLSEMTAAWKGNLDSKEGGPNRSPKFPLPNNYEFLLNYSILSGDEVLKDHVKLTLDKMSKGGIYDQIGGGFARYSTDAYWKVPHFEKMLYDNAQLISLYSRAYQYFKKEEYKIVIEESIEFIERELTGHRGELYSALDADSEGEEGKFYVWSASELESLNGINLEVMKEVYTIKAGAQWEGNYILHETDDRDKIARKLNMSRNDLDQEIEEGKKILLEERSKRIRPGLDDKSLTSWSALMISAYCRAYAALGKKEYLEKSRKNAERIWGELFDHGILYHNYKNKKISIEGFLEDYALTAHSFIHLYEVDFDEVWLERAKKLTEICLEKFYSTDKNMFYFTSEDQEDIIARKMEIYDNVIPSSNSVMGHVLFDLGLLLDHHEFQSTSLQMLQNIAPFTKDHGSSFSNWALLMLKNTFDFYEIAIVGNEARRKFQEMNAHYIPNGIFICSSTESQLPLLENKFMDDKTMIYVCVNKACQMPTEKIEEAISQISGL